MKQTFHPENAVRGAVRFTVQRQDRPNTTGLLQPKQLPTASRNAASLRRVFSLRSIVGFRRGDRRKTGVYAALASAFFLGMAPVFGKSAINLGWPPLGVVAFRTTAAALLMLAGVLIFRRQYVFIYPAGLLGCIIAGSINGLGSLFYYSALERIGAGVGQLLYSLYPFFVVVWLWLDHQPPSRLTLARLVLIIPALYLLSQTGSNHGDLLGGGMMLIASALYALHLPINQRVLYDMPAPTVTLYTLLAMSAVVVPAYLLSGRYISSVRCEPLQAGPAAASGWEQVIYPMLPVLALTLVTFLSRLTLFLGVKNLGGMQTALLGLGELLVAVSFSHLWLGERLSQAQWVGTLLLIGSLGLIGFEKDHPGGLGRRQGGGWLNWLRPPGLPPDLP